MTEFDRRWYADYALHGDEFLRIFRPPDPEETASQVDGLIRLLDLAPGSRLLDLACGWGRIAVPLARRGYQVTGLDISQRFLGVGAEAAGAAGVAVDFRQGDMREIPFAGEFDAVIMMWSAFAVLESDEEDQKVLDAVARALRPGGRFFMHQMSREWVIRNYRARDWVENEDGALVLHDRTLHLVDSRNYVRMIVVEPDGSRRSYQHIFRFYTLTELARMLGRAGLPLRNVWGDFDGSVYSVESRLMLVLGQKPTKHGGQSEGRAQ